MKHWFCVSLVSQWNMCHLMFIYIYSEAVFWFKILFITNCCVIDFIEQLYWICDWLKEKSRYFITKSEPVMVGRDQNMESGEMIEFPPSLASFYRKFILSLTFLGVWSKAFRSLRSHNNETDNHLREQILKSLWGHLWN